MNSEKILDVARADLDALRVVERQSRESPGDVVLREQLAHEYLKNGFYSEARTEFTELVLTDDSNAKFHVGRAFALLMLHEYVGAQRVVQRALSLDPSNVEAQQLADKLKNGIGSLSLTTLRTFDDSSTFFPSDLQIYEQANFIFHSILEHPKHELYAPADFWRHHAKRHLCYIMQSGFANFKKTVNYFYNQAGVSMGRNEDLRKAIFQKTGRSNLMETPRFSIDEWDYLSLTIDFPISSPADYSEFVALLWEWACEEDKIGCLKKCEEPIVGNPIRIWYQGRLVTQDLATSSLELNFIHNALGAKFGTVKRICEIGSGYGRLAFMIANTFPEVQTCLFDIPPALAVAQNYLALVLGARSVKMFQPGPPEKSLRRVQCYSPDQLEDFPDGYFDLVINISSFDEMSKEQVHNYFELIARKCKGWLYIKAQPTKPAASSSSSLGMDQFPYKESWQPLTLRPVPYHRQFSEAVFELRSDLVHE